MSADMIAAAHAYGDALADAALTARAQKLGLGLARRLAIPETAETMAQHRAPAARDIGISSAEPDGPNAGQWWLDIVMADGRHLSATLSPELLAKLATQIARAKATQP
jgi:hypothetical protein